MSHHVLVIGDCHFQDKSMLESQLLTTKVLQIVANNSYNFIVMLGDLQHQHDLLHMQPHNLAMSFLKNLSKLCKTFFIVGNHDLRNNNVFQTKEHSYTVLDDYPNLHIIDKSVYITIDTKNYFFVPYVSPGRFYEALLTTSENETQLQERFKVTTAIFAHQEFKGANLGAVKSTKGDVWNLTFPLVISGHIHGFDVLQENIIYPGTPYQTTFDDSIDKTISDFKFLEVQEKYEHQRIDLGLPKKKIIRIQVSELEDFKIPEGYQIKLKIIGTDSEIKGAMKSEKIKVLESSGVFISWSTILKKKQYDPTIRNDVIYLKKLEEKISLIPRLPLLLKEFY